MALINSRPETAAVINHHKTVFSLQLNFTLIKSTNSWQFGSQYDSILVGMARSLQQFTIKKNCKISDDKTQANTEYYKNIRTDDDMTTAEVNI